MFFQISSWWRTCVIFLPTVFLLLRVFTSSSHGSVITFKNVTVMKNVKSGWTRKCLCYFIYPHTENLLKRLWPIGKWDLLGQKHLKLQWLTFPSRTSQRVRIDVWIVLVLLIISGWKCLPTHFPRDLEYAFQVYSWRAATNVNMCPLASPSSSGWTETKQLCLQEPCVSLILQSQSLICVLITI